MTDPDTSPDISPYTVASGAPVIAETAFVHETAVVLGRVMIGEHASVWSTAVIRGDTDRITIGARSNVQDGAVIHADPGVPTTVGADCVIGHRAIVHGSTLEDGVLVGMGAILLNGVYVEQGSVIGAGAVVPEGMRVPAGSLVMGVPARVVRALDAERQAAIVKAASQYVALAERHRSGAIERGGTTVK